MTIFIIFWISFFAIIFWILSVFVKMLISTFNAILMAAQDVLSWGLLTSGVGILLGIIYALIEGFQNSIFWTIACIILIFIGMSIILPILGVIIDFLLNIFVVGSEIILTVLEYISYYCEKIYIKLIEKMMSRLEI